MRLTKDLNNKRGSVAFQRGKVPAMIQFWEQTKESDEIMDVTGQRKASADSSDDISVSVPNLQADSSISLQTSDDDHQTIGIDEVDDGRLIMDCLATAPSPGRLLLSNWPTIPRIQLTNGISRAIVTTILNNETGFLVSSCKARKVRPKPVFVTAPTPLSTKICNA